MAELSLYAEQIKALHNNGASIEDIAIGMDIAVEEVKTVLLHTSPKFRAAAFAAPDGTQTDKQLSREMLMIAATIARSSDMDGIRLSAAKFVRDDLEGRRDVLPPDAGMNTNALTELQAGLVIARQRRLEFLKGRNATIDIPGAIESGNQPDGGGAARCGGEAPAETVPAGNAEG